MPPEDAATYDMLCEGKSVGVFQVESRAQMAMLPRLQPRCFHDLVVQVAIVRPDNCHLHNKIMKTARLQARQHRHLGA